MSKSQNKPTIRRFLPRSSVAKRWCCHGAGLNLMTDEFFIDMCNTFVHDKLKDYKQIVSYLPQFVGKDAAHIVEGYYSEDEEILHMEYRGNFSAVYIYHYEFLTIYMANGKLYEYYFDDDSSYDRGPITDKHEFEGFDLYDLEEFDVVQHIIFNNYKTYNIK